MFRLNPWSARGASHHATFMDNYDYHSHVFSLIHPVDEFSFKEMRTWGQSKISPCCFCVWYKSRKIGGRGSARFTNGGELFRRPSSYRKLLIESHLEFC